MILIRSINLGDNFTLGELDSFTLGELSLPVNELLDLIKNENRSISVSAYEKLTQLYNELEAECHTSEDANIKTSKFPKLETAANLSKDLGQIVLFLMNLYKACDTFEIKQRISDFIVFIISIIKDNT